MGPIEQRKCDTFWMKRKFLKLIPKTVSSFGQVERRKFVIYHDTWVWHLSINSLPAYYGNSHGGSKLRLRNTWRGKLSNQTQFKFYNHVIFFSISYSPFYSKLLLFCVNFLGLHAFAFTSQTPHLLQLLNAKNQTCPGKPFQVIRMLIWIRFMTLELPS